ncbi:MAG: M20/M25/M40 family metallo-hydrolase [Thermoanaerobaculia bacterium]
MRGVTRFIALAPLLSLSLVSPTGHAESPAAKGTSAAPASPALSIETRAGMEQVLGAAMGSSRAFENLRTLTDTVGPRLAGSPGDRAAVAWALETLTALGFSRVRAEKVAVPHWERGEESGALVHPTLQPLALTALGSSVPTPEAGLEAEVVEADSLEAVDALGEKARGKIVLLWKLTERARDGAGYGKTVALRVSGASRAAKVGAIGVLVRSVSTADTRLPHTGDMHYEEGAPKIPGAALSTPDADLLHRLLQSGVTPRVRFRLSCRTLPDAESANVIGEIRGREKPDEIVVLGAHLDSWDLGTGAVDDGAGCVTMIEAARIIGAMTRRPRRTLRVVLYANEENGARGAKAYVIAHEKELGLHVAALEADSGAGPAYGFTYSTGPGSGGRLQEIAALLAGIGAGELKDGGNGGTDIAPLRAAGVPLFGVRQDASKYFDVHHSADDTLDKVDRRDLDSGVALAAVLAYALADLPEPLARIAPEAKAP